MWVFYKRANERDEKNIFFSNSKPLMGVKKWD